MRRSVTDAAHALRRGVRRDGPAPATFAAALDAVPREYRDAWLDCLWGIDELPGDDPGLPRGCVPYLPCPVALALEAILVARVTRDDVFVDVGAGLGRVVALTHLLTGAPCFGLEIQPGLVEAARERAARLKLGQVRFLEGDAADLIPSMTVGSVFFLYCPFGGPRLARVLDDLEGIARKREIRVCCVDMPALERPWLAPVASGSPELCVYRSE